MENDKTPKGIDDRNLEKDWSIEEARKLLAKRDKTYQAARKGAKLTEKKKK